LAKKIIIKGVGTFMAKKYSADGKGVEVITLGTMQDLKIDFNVELEDIFGGDGLFAIDTLVKSKSIEISATDAKFDLDAVRLMMGSNVQEQVNSYVWVLGEQGVTVTAALNPAAATPINIAKVVPTYATTIYGDGNFSVRLKDSNTLLTKVAYDGSTAPAIGEFQIETTTNAIILNEANSGKEIVLNYQRQEVVDLVDLIVDEVPFPVHIIHHGSFLQKDGTYQGVETELYMCRAKGSFSIDTARTTASTTSVQLQVLDPERADGKLGSIKRYDSGYTRS